jgi:hypothetical protein
MKIVTEPNCARKARRLTSPMTVNIGGRVLTVKNWSTGGLLMQADVFEKDRIEEGELLMPCRDGVFVLPVQIHPIHWQSGFCGCRFVDMPPRERSILHAYADFIIRGQSATVTQLEESARAVLPGEEPPASLAETADIPAWRRFILRMHVRRLMIIAALLLAIGTIASMAIPAITHKFSTMSWSRDEFLKRSQAALDEQQAALAEVNDDIDKVNNLLGSSLNGVANINNEQLRLLREGLRKLEAQRKAIEESSRSLSEKIADAQNARFYVANPFSGMFDKAFDDPAPFMADFLKNMNLNGRIEIHSEAEIQKYLLVAQARVKQAQAALDSTRTKREALERILKRVDEAGQQAGFPLNQRELMERDVQLLRIEEDRLTNVLAMLNDNVEAVKKGNFIYEKNLLQKFDSEPTHSLGVAPDNNMLN